MTNRRFRVLLIASLTFCATAFSAPPDTAGQTGRGPLVPTAAVDTTTDSLASDTLAGKGSKPAGISEPITYQADAIDYDMDNRVLHLNGNAEILYQEITLNADSIEYLIGQDLFIARGSPQLVEGGDTTVGESMTYNIKTRRGSLVYASTHMDEAFFNGQHIVKARDNVFFARNGDYSTCASIENPHYYFYAKDVKVVPGDKAYARPAVFNVAEVPVGALPYLVLPLDRNRVSGMLTPAFGGNVGNNFYVDNLGYYWAPNDYMDFTAASRVMEFRDFVLSGSARYAVRYWLGGSLSARYTLNNDFQASTNQWAIDYSHNQTLTPDNTLNLAGRGNLVSGSRFYKNFSEDTTELLNKTISANLELSKRFTKINASANVSWSRTQNLVDSSMTENLPSVNFSLPSRPLIPEKPAWQKEPGDTAGPKWFNKIYYDYRAGAINKHFINPKAAFEAERDYMRSGVSSSSNWSYNQKVLKYFDFSPSFGVSGSAVNAYKDTLPEHRRVIRDTSYIYKTLHWEEIPASRRDLSDTTYHDTTLYVTNKFGEPDTLYRVKDSTVLDSTVYYAPNMDWVPDYTWHAGASLATTMYGLFPIRILNFVGLRHTMQPSVSYTFTPTHRPPRGVPEGSQYYNIGIPTPVGKTVKQAQTINFGLNNDFHGKIVKPSLVKDEKPVENKFHMLGLGASAGYNFEAEGPKWSDLSLDARNSNKFFNVTYGSQFWLHDEDGATSVPLLRSYDVRVSPQFKVGGSGTLWDGDRFELDSAEIVRPRSALAVAARGPGAGMQPWQLSLSPSYSFSQSRTTQSAPFVTTKNYWLSATGSLNFTRAWSASWTSRYDFVASEFVGHSFNFYCDLECWEMRFDWSPSGVNPGFYFVVRIKKIPEIKWEQRD